MTVAVQKTTDQADVSEEEVAAVAVAVDYTADKNLITKFKYVKFHSLLDETIFIIYFIYWI